MAHVVSNKEQVLNLINRYIIAAVLVCDMETNRVLFANDFAQREMGVEEGSTAARMYIVSPPGAAATAMSS